LRWQPYKIHRFLKVGRGGTTPLLWRAAIIIGRLPRSNPRLWPREIKLSRVKLDGPDVVTFWVEEFLRCDEEPYGLPQYRVLGAKAMTHRLHKATRYKGAPERSWRCMKPTQVWIALGSKR